MLVLLLGGSVFSEELPVLAQIAPGMREGPGTMGRGQPSAMPMQKVSEVVKQMADHLASGKKLGPGKAKRLRALADQLVAAARQMSEGMGGGMMGGGMMG
ncbi:MAG: hypothetical protein HYY85_10740, partial [Deltaproteobacteria bacterium]|nr:hypothetical protein [Deltaproteobacteria bacterium]